MRIEHTVVFRLEHPSGSDAENGFLDTAQARLASIPGVEGFAIRRQVSPKSDLDWQFSMQFADQSAYQGYNEHPAHREFVVTRWDSKVAEFQEYDFTAIG